MARGEGKYTAKLDADGNEVTRNGLTVYRVRYWDNVLKKQIEKTAYGEDDAKLKLAAVMVHKVESPSTSVAAHRVRVEDLLERYLTWYAMRPNGKPRTNAAINKQRTTMKCYVLPGIGKTYIGDVTHQNLNAMLRQLTLQNGEPAAPGTQETAVSVIRSFFKWCRYDGLMKNNPTEFMAATWGEGSRRKAILPSSQEVSRLALAMDVISPGYGDVVKVIAFVGLRWEELAGVSRDNVDLDRQEIRVDRTASESGGKRHLTMLEGKTNAAMRTVVIPDMAMPFVRRLLERDSAAFADRGTEPPVRRVGQSLADYHQSPEYMDWYRTCPYARFVNGDMGGFISYATWRRNLVKAKGYTAATGGEVTYTAHGLRHFAASVLIGSGALDHAVATQMGHGRVEYTKNVYAELFAMDRDELRARIDARLTKLFVHEAEPVEGKIEGKGTGKLRAVADL